jgi:hypothetical protein
VTAGYAGRSAFDSPRGLGSGRAEAWLTPVGSGSRLRFAATVQVKIPLVGRKLENSMGADLAENIPMIQRFTTAWITEPA